MASKIIQKICNRIEEFFSKRRLNPILTIWLNFRCLPFLQALKLPIYIYGRPIIYNSRCKIIIDSEIIRGMIKFNQQRIWAPSLMNQQSEFNCSGTIIFKGSGMIGTGTKICLNTNSILEIGKNFTVADCVNIGCNNLIKIGNNCRIAHRCQIFDTNYHYIANINNHTVKSKTQQVIIGNNCWICNSSTILPGTILPNYTIVSSNSLVNKDFSKIPNNSILAGIPAKLIGTGFIRVENKDYESEIDNHFSQKKEIFVIPEAWNEESISTVL